METGNRRERKGSLLPGSSAYSSGSHYRFPCLAERNAGGGKKPGSTGRAGENGAAFSCTG